MIERYIKVEWPDTQKFQELQNLPEYVDSCYECYYGDEPTMFVPEDLYFKVMK